MCHEIEERIYLYDELSEHDRSETDLHIASCASCRTVMESARELRNQSARYRMQPAPEAREILTERIMASVTEKPRTRQFHNLILAPFIRYGMAAVSTALLIAFCADYSIQEEPVASKQFPRKTPATADAASVNRVFLATRAIEERNGKTWSACIMSCSDQYAPLCAECSQRFIKPE